MSGEAEYRSLIIHCRDVNDVPFHASDGPALEANSIDLWFLDLSNTSVIADHLLHLLDNEEKHRADRYVFAKDRERYIIGHAMLRLLLARYMDREPLDIRILRGAHGKPYVEGTDLQFNLSDTKDAVAIGLTLGKELGVDVETMQRRVDHDAVSEHYFTPPEVDLIERAGPLAKRRFLELWTRKEAVLKASGVGIMDDLHTLRVDAPKNEVRIAHKEFMRMAEAEYHVDTYAVGGTHILSTAIGVANVRMRLMDGVGLITN